ncbi:Long-chain-fatty-acid--CoA ligase [Acidisarcina polymorpha]|uniref:Long-chain-fatty-acid--CoA ligase n=1 Tax=Acidisarcina polymorpha TaxID=2211140 RepID=A0A2Z5G8D1_9BACT|nr:AMP-binding protein [Acidisarcina polymorpha]AXC15077.1 Long-chain-fatty-acid--CoA ligase [Acidisarcina polymorpha]
MRANLATLVEDFRRHGAQTAVVVYRGNRRYATSYRELALLAGRFSAELARRGIGPGERVVLWGENSAEWIAAFFGCLLRGVIAVPLDAAGSGDFGARVIADVAPRLIAGDRSLLARAELPGSSKPPQLSFLDFADSLPAEPLFTVDPSVSDVTPLQIVFTSGTTSEPKGVVHTHRNVLASLGPIEREIGKYLKYERIFHPLRFLHSLPLSHVFGQFMGLWVPPLLAAEVHFESQLEPSRLIATIRRERISVLAAVPRVLEPLRTHLLASDPRLAEEMAAGRGERVWKHWWRFRGIHRAFGFKFWAIVCGGASLPQELEEFWNTLGFALIQGYGLTETAALVTLNHPFKIGRGTIGKPLPGREVRLGENGEILVRGDMLSTSSWQGGRLQPRQDEWLATGDLAARDASGELRFVGRQSDVIVSASGMNIHAADLEAALCKQPGVRSCVVVGCPALGGTEPLAVVIDSGVSQSPAANGISAADGALAEAVRGANRELAEFQQIRRWVRWPEMEFPYTPTGKLLRRRVADWACAALARPDEAGREAGDGDWLLRLIASVSGAKVTEASDASLLSEDLQLDSLGRVQLQSALEQQLGVELPDDAMEGVRTLGELRALVSLPGRRNVEERVERRVPAPETPSDRATKPDDHRYPFWPWTTPVRWLRVLFLETVMRPLVWLLAAPQVIRDSSGLPDGPLLIIANHVSSYDAALVLYALPPKLRHRVAVAMSGEMLRDFREGRRQSEFRFSDFGPVAYFLITALFNVFPLPRSMGFRRSFAHAGQAMDRGYSVLIFPEGHRSEDGRLHPFRSGIGILAAESRVPILPVALRGVGEIKQAKSKWFRSGKLMIHVGRIQSIDEAVGPAVLTQSLEEVIRGM